MLIIFVVILVIWFILNILVVNMNLIVFRYYDESYIYNDAY